MPEAADIILKWPENTLAYAVSAASVFLFFAAFVYIGAKFIFQEQSRRSDDWSRVYRWALKNKLTGREIKFLQAFVYSLTVKERKAVIEHKKRFKDLLLAHLAESEEDDRMKIHMMGKLFPEVETPSEIHSAADLYTGEHVMLEYDESHYLCRITSVKEGNTVVLYSLSKKHIHIPEEFPVSLYAYRKGFGAYLLSCHLQSRKGRNAALKYDGRTDFLGKIHLMADLEIGFEVRPFPELYLKEEYYRKAEEEGMPPPDLTLRLHGTALKISDRAMLFRFVYRGADREDPMLAQLKHFVDVDQTLIMDEAILHRQELWQLSMTLPSGYVLLCEGKILPDKRHRGYNLFRFVNLSPDSEKALLYDIKKAGAVPEKLI